MIKILRNILHLPFDDKIHEGEVVDLYERYRIDGSFDDCPTVVYDILRHQDKEKVGTLDLRLSIKGNLYYYGHIGYRVALKHRGHRYAYHACKVCFKIAKEEFGMDEIYITCSPDNIASYKTLTMLDGELVETVDVPMGHELYFRDEKIKCIFKYKI